MANKFIYVILLSIISIIITFTGCEETEELVLDSITPNQGYETGGTPVSLNGEHFDKNTKVYFGDSLTTIVQYHETNYISTVSPRHPPGLVDVKVKNTGGQSAILTDAFTFMEGKPPSSLYKDIRYYNVGDQPMSNAIADFNQDGFIDIVVCHYYDGNLVMLLNQGNGTFQRFTDVRSFGNCMGVYSADYDGDGDSDIAVCATAAGILLVLLNNGDATFANRQHYQAGNTPVSVSGADLDDDGDIDLVVTNADYGAGSGNSSTISVFMNNGDGTFSKIVNYSYGTGNGAIEGSDLDNDGDTDMVILNSIGDIPSTTEALIFMNNGDGTFVYIENLTFADTQAGIFIFDIDNDGNMDIAASSNTENVISVRFNIGNGTFGPLINYPAGNNLGNVNGADLDYDGDVDLVVSNGRPHNKIAILYNQLY
jgi:hypothetical protein